MWSVTGNRTFPFVKHERKREGLSQDVLKEPLALSNTTSIRQQNEAFALSITCDILQLAHYGPVSTTWESPQFWYGHAHSPDHEEAPGDCWRWFSVLSSYLTAHVAIRCPVSLPSFCILIV